MSIHAERPRHRSLTEQSLANLLADMHFDSVNGVRKQRAAEHLTNLLTSLTDPDAAPHQSAHQRATIYQGLDGYLTLAL